MIRWRSSDCPIFGQEFNSLTQLPLASILRHDVHFLSVTVIVCNIPFHFWVYGTECGIAKLGRSKPYNLLIPSITPDRDSVF